LWNNPTLVHGQRFLRQGFSNNEDFGSEMKLDESDSSNAFDMTREMFLMQDLMWQIQPPIVPLRFSKDTISNPQIRKHIQQYINTNQPIDIRLLKKRGKYGLRAVGRTADGTKLRAFWRQSIVPPVPMGPPVSSSSSSSSSGTQLQAQPQQRGIDFLKASYDDACRTRLFTVEFELQLPPVSKKEKHILPSIVYQVSLEPGSMNPKALVPRSAGRVYVYPTGRRTTTITTSSGTTTSNNISDKVEVGKAYISAAPMKPGIVDPSWAKGRPIFRKGRNSGLM
jgi:hypothetical protein